MPKIIDHDQYREELLRGCYAVFATHGYARLTMREVAKQLGVSTGTLYHYFPTKQALFEKLVLSVSSADQANALNATDQAKSPKARLERLLAFIESAEDYFLSQDLILTDYVRTVTAESGAVSPAIAEAAERYVTLTAEHLETTRARANFVLVFIAGLLSRRFIDGKETSFREQAKLLVRLLFPDG